MNVLALKQGRKKAHQKRLQGETKVERGARLERALKAVNLNLQSPPAAQLASLEIYLENLQLLREELLRKYGDVLGSVIFKVDVEIQHTIEHLVHLRIEQLQPQGKELW